MFTSDQIDAVAIAAIKGEGHTEFNGPEKYAGRYVVGGLATDTFPAGFPNVRQIVADLARNATAETLGCWENNGIVYIDLGDTWTHLSAALQVASQRGELAIWDRLTGTAIATEGN